LYGDQPQQQGQQQQLSQMTEEERRYAEEEAYYRQGDMWYGKQNNDTALQIREAVYNAVDIPNSQLTFDEWRASRTLALTRASRIPGIDTQMLRRLVRDRRPCPFAGEAAYPPVPHGKVSVQT
jgi:hypothetical protein